MWANKCVRNRYTLHFALYLCSLLCHLLHEVRGGWRKQALVLKSSLEHVIYAFVSITKLLVLVLYVFCRMLCLQYQTRHDFREVLKVFYLSHCKKLMETRYMTLCGKNYLHLFSTSEVTADVSYKCCFRRPIYVKTEDILVIEEEGMNRLVKLLKCCSCSLAG